MDCGSVDGEVVVSDTRNSRFDVKCQHTFGVVAIRGGSYGSNHDHYFDGAFRGDVSRRDITTLRRQKLTMKIFGVDFTSVPISKKAITFVQCRLDENDLFLESSFPTRSFDEFEKFLQQPGPWVAEWIVQER